jgi:hypothetical protein
MKDIASPTVRARRAPLGLCVLAVMLVLAGLASVARADDPIVSVGPVAAPSRGDPASAAVGSSGRADACVNGSQSWADPSGAEPDGPVQVNSDPCQASGSSSPGTSDGASSAAGAKQSAGSGGRSPARGSGGTSNPSVAWVAAADAVGLRIASIRYGTSAVPVTRRLRVTVTLRDTRGRRVRDAIVLLRPVPRAEITMRNTQAAFSDRLGQSRFTVEVAKEMLGKIYLLNIVARTPTARALHVGAVRLPGPRSR